MFRTDYLVVGAGACGLAFADALLAASDVDVTLVDRRPGVGGHWRDAYSFVRLHTPSAYYGVDSLSLGEDRVDRDGENAGCYERAAGADVREYFEEASARLAATGRVRVLTGHDHLGGQDGDEVVRDLSTGALRHVSVRRKVVDARYLEASVPATHDPTFEIDDDAGVVSVNDLPAAARAGASYTILGAGKTSVDACMWLLDHDVDADRIRWVRPRDAWFHDRAHFQPLDQVGAVIKSIAQDAEAGAEAADLDDLVERLEASGRLLRLDASAPTTMYRATMLSARELDALRQVQDVVRLGRVRRIEADRIVLERGEVATRPHIVHVDCTARGLRTAPAVPIFQDRRIVLQQVRHNSPTFNAALVGVVEAHRDHDTDKNRLCPPNPYPQGIGDWPRMTARTWTTERRWTSEPDVASWVARSRLNLLRALPDHMAEPSVRAAATRYVTRVGEAIERLQRLDREAGRTRFVDQDHQRETR
jgi:hypothetical protein